ncbi:MAG: amidohydrolase family protein, partial [Pseudomonadota bacterium]
MTEVIKNGTVVTADLSYEADVAIENGVITEIGPNLKGDEELDATGCYVMPGGIDPHVHLEMPFMGTYSSDNFESGTRAALSGGTTMVVDFCLPNQGESLLDAIKRWDNKSTQANCDYSFHMAVTWWGEQVFNDMKTVVQDRGINTFKHFLAYKGALMVNDDELFSSFKRLSELGAIAMVHAENGDVVAEMTAKLLAEGNTGPEAHAYSRPSQVEGEATNRAIMIADMAGVPLYVVHVSCEEAHEAIRRAKQNGKRVWGEPLIQHLTLDESEYFHDDWDHAARRVMSPPFRNKKHQDSLWAG